MDLTAGEFGAPANLHDKRAFDIEIITSTTFKLYHFSKSTVPPSVYRLLKHNQARPSRRDVVRPVFVVHVCIRPQDPHADNVAQLHLQPLVRRLVQKEPAPAAFPLVTDGRILASLVEPARLVVQVELEALASEVRVGLVPSDTRLVAVKAGRPPGGGTEVKVGPRVRLPPAVGSEQGLEPRPPLGQPVRVVPEPDHAEVRVHGP
ncbi:hypothetical protein PoMZ_12485 [Pyricularia oryzae]|uniref:Uncharacterized protein n=1 Tax=Pyricularia oryzae TaxID=318829 RepID=A0A4P7NSZ2_PYROR|nr:hypothetical protein PoMZ_12485 [Pyricularia oryzae]